MVVEPDGGGGMGGMICLCGGGLLVLESSLEKARDRGALKRWVDKRGDDKGRFLG
jgi:hypothetical protein